LVGKARRAIASRGDVLPRTLLRRHAETRGDLADSAGGAICARPAIAIACAGCNVAIVGIALVRAERTDGEVPIAAAPRRWDHAVSAGANRALSALPILGTTGTACVCIRRAGEREARILDAEGLSRGDDSKSCHVGIDARQTDRFEREIWDVRQDRGRLSGLGVLRGQLDLNGWRLREQRQRDEEGLGKKCRFAEHRWTS